MCGRFTQKAPWEKVKEEFGVKAAEDADLKPRYNIAPSQPIATVRVIEGATELSLLKWGLVPSWAKDSEIGNRMINARAETLTEKPSFRDAFKKRRCIIPATGFFEWSKKGSGAKQPFYFYLKDKEVFGFAGLWEEWLDRDTGELLETCTIITTEANEILKPIHDRMPVIVKPNDYERWLNTQETKTGNFESILAPYPAEEMTSHAVSRVVNSPTEDSPTLIENSL
jgi:putative SOS response-associated peptidase YedK